MTAQQEKDWQKRVKWDNVHLQTLDNFEDNSYLLTERQANALLNVIKQMKWASRWDDSISLDEIDEFASEIAYRLTYPSGCGDCTEYPPWASLVEWFPQNPYTEPDFVPSGYVFPPWYIGNDVSASVYDAELNAAITTYERIPPGVFPIPIPPDGFPRFRVNVNGKGTVEMHFANVNFGSLIQVQVDNDLLSLVWVDTNQDQFAIPPESANRTIVEREFTTDGDHWIDCTVVPMVDDEAPFVTYGGGLIKVVLCGFNPPYEGTGSDLMGLAMRLNAQCEMEFSIDDGQSWDVVQDWVLNANSCFLGDTGASGLDGTDGTDGDDGDDGTDGTDGDDGQTANVFPPSPTEEGDPDGLCGAVHEIANELNSYIQATITDAATITLEEFLTALLALGGFEASLLNTFWEFFVANANPNLDTEVSSAIDAVAGHFYCAALDRVDAIAAIDADGTITDDAQAAYIGAINSLTDGKLSLWAFVGSQDDTQDCDSYCPFDWCYEFDMSVAAYGSGGWYVPGAPNFWNAFHDGSVWYEDIRFTSPNGYQFSWGIDIPVGTVITQVEMTDECPAPTALNYNMTLTDYVNGGTTGNNILADAEAANNHALETRVYNINTEIEYDGFQIAVTGAPATGSRRYNLHKLILRGTGSDPMLSGVSCQ